MTLVHVIWGGGPLPAEYAGNIARYRHLNPDHDLQVWDDDTIRREHIDHADLYDHASDIVPADSVWQFRSDLARYSILYRYGGIYIDCDYLWQHPIPDPMVNAAHGTDTRLHAAWETQYRWIANGIIATPPGHPVLEHALELIPQTVAARRRGPIRANRITGPGGLWTRVIKQHYADVHLWHQQAFHPAPWRHPEWATTRDYPDAIAVHTWGHQRSIRTDTTTTAGAVR